MWRCLQLANNGLGSTYPNPLVGCVIVCGGKIIGEGWHRKAGEPHAEVMAIASVKDKSLLEKSELYVNLEPCSHFGKTPPCADLIVRHKIPKVFIGNVDWNEQVKGRGVNRLRESGCEVVAGILELACRSLNKRFFTFHEKSRPYIMLKWAQSSDGYLYPDMDDNKTAKPIWISNEFSRQLVHKWRAEEEAILVGSKTVIKDDPGLTVRDFRGNSMLRLVIDKEGESFGPRKLFKDAERTWTFVDRATKESIDSSTWQETTLIELDFDREVVLQIIEHLWKEGVQSLIVEGGAITLQAFIDSGMWDEARVFEGASIFAGGIAAPQIKLPATRVENVRDDRLVIYKNPDEYEFL